MRKGLIVLLELALVAGAAAPCLSIQSLFPCVVPADCPAMSELCDMTGMTSHDSCCHPSSAKGDSALPASVSGSGLDGPESSAQMPGFAVILLAAQPVADAEALLLAAPPPGSPPGSTVLRI